MPTLSRTSQNDTLAGHTVYLDTRVLNSHHNKRTRPRHTRSEGVGFKRGTKQTVQNLANAIGYDDLADRVGRCHGHVTVITCGRHVKRVIPDYTCGFRLCPECAKRKASKYVHRYLPAVLAYMKHSGTTPCTLTLTQKDLSEPLYVSIRRLKANIRKLQKSKLFKSLFLGGDWHVEWTFTPAGLFHVHSHSTVFRVSEDKMSDENLQRLKDTWLKITGDSHVLHLGWIDPNQDGGMKRAMFEVMKYPMKPADVAKITPDQFREIADLGREHLSGTFGAYRKFCATYDAPPDVTASLFPPTATGIPCPDCGAILYEVRLKDSERADYYRRLDASPALE